MVNAYGIMELGVKTLRAQQLAMEVASHNIANANTPGYSRQVAVMETTDPASLGSIGQFGTGVEVGTIQRVYDSFTTAQINAQMQNFGEASAKRSLLQSAELVFNEASGDGLRSALADYFGAWEGLANNPESQAERQSVIQNGNSLVMAFRSIAQHIGRVVENTEKSLDSTVNEINSLSEKILQLNLEIKVIEAGGENANDLRDKRGLMLQDLSEKVGINTLEMDDGTVSIFLNKGIMLVEGITRQTLITEVVNDQRIVSIRDDSGNTTDITQIINGGAIGGLVAGRDENLNSYLTELNELAARLTIEVNKAHTGGYGLDGSTNNLFFDQVPISTGANSANTGGAAINAGAITDTTALSADDYEIRFTSSSTYDLVNTTTGVTEVTGASYTSGGNIAVNGITAVITDGGSGPANGDVFSVGIDKANYANNMALNSAVTGSTNKIAAAQQDPLTVSGVGDNRVALEIGGLVNSDIMNQGTATFIESYSILVSSVGSDVNESETNEEFYNFTVQQLKNIRESVSGVSIDEETTDLIKFQNGYAAGARLINMASELMDILVNLGR